MCGFHDIGIILLKPSAYIKSVCISAPGPMMAPVLLQSRVKKKLSSSLEGREYTRVLREISCEDVTRIEVAPDKLE